MSPQARQSELSIYEGGLTPDLEGIVPSVRGKVLSRVLEVAVLLLVCAWGFQVFSLWVGFLKWGTLLQMPQ